MKPAEERLARDLDALEIGDARMPLVNNADAQVVRAAAAIRDGLKRQVTAPVRWEQSMRVLRAKGVRFFIEVGPGKVLSGLLRQIDREALSSGVEDLASLNETLDRKLAGQ
jgi:[acyl-carrier-protein] S-malonyltransferase